MADPIKIKFYHQGKDYYDFTNFAKGYPINFPQISGWENLLGNWPSAEHLFQAAKFANWPECVEIFKNLDTSQGTREAFQQAVKKAKQKAGKPWIPSWHGSGSGSWEGDGSNAKKIEIMRLIVREKFSQHPKLKDLLLKTGNKEIIEDTESDTARPKKDRDNCWGNANNGMNWLGKILVEVRTKFQNEGPPLDSLKDLKGNIINQINQKMAEDPEIKASELQDKNQKWEDEIQKATQKDQIKSICNELKADIETKRKDKKLVQAFQKLISQAQQARQAGNIDILKQLLLQIYGCQENSGLYSQYESEIKQWETYMNQQDTNAFKDLKIDAINNLLQQEPKVAITELREFNRGFQRIISQTSDFTKIDNFESVVRDNVFEVRTEKKFNQLLTSAQNAKSEEEKSLVTQQIYKWRDSGERWENEIWLRRNGEAMAFLDKWSRGKDDDNNDENTKDESHWLKQVFQIAAVGISLVLVIWLLAKLVKRGRKFK